MRRAASGWLRVLVGLGLGGLLVLAALPAVARVGGGQSFGGGGAGGGGGGGDGGLVIYLVYLALRHPVIGVPVLILIAVGWYLKNRHDRRHALPASSQQNLARLRSGAAAQQRARVQAQLEALQADDPNFSETLFLDFAQMIYVRYQQARGSQQAEGLKPYLSERLFAGLARAGTRLARGSFQVEDVVVGSLSIATVVDAGDQWRIVCDVEANYTERSQPAGESERSQAWFVRSRLIFERNKGLLSKGPEQIRTLGCPSCGSPLKLDEENVCAYCGRPVVPGLFHWELAGLEEGVPIQRRDVPLSLGGVETGTDFPTLFDPDLDVASKAFLLRYPGESLQALKQRAREVFLALQQAWTTGNWEQARAFETDRLYQTHLFWMTRYRERGLRNVLEQVEVRDVILVKLSRDAFFESASLRIFASMIDYTQDRYGNVIGGSRDAPRVFSEYWTFLRRAGFEPGRQSNTTTCPSCGAPVKVGMNGRCEYCDANLASGEFDWTLAKIEQDEAYAG